MERLNDWGSATGGVWKGIFASVLLHAAAAAAVLFTVSAPPERAPLVVDLTMDGPEGTPPAREGHSSMAPPQPETPAAIRRNPAPAAPMPAAGADPRTARAPEPPPASATPSPPFAQTGGPAPAPPEAGSSERSPSPPGTAVSGGSALAGIPGPSGGRSPRAGGGAGQSGEARTPSPGGFPARNFAYIRDAIQRRIAYPALARRMGWEGKVVVAFLVRSDGSVRDVRVVQGSGYPSLDRGAVDAVRQAAPFPRPPSEAEIITPVVYRLE